MGFNLIALIILVVLVTHRSSEPWIFGLYSLSYFVLLVFFILFVMFVNVLLKRFRGREIHLLFAALVSLIVSFGMIEVLGQIYAGFRPSYRVLFWQPDQDLGWKLVPNFKATWTGHHWYARDFSVPITTNAYGFRDVPRSFEKPEEVTRVAVLGDSFVEALQVPFEKMASSLLEDKLNLFLKKDKDNPVDRYEVMNFGVSNFGVGQYFLTWEKYASQFDPQYVFIFVADFNMTRTTQQGSATSFTKKRSKPLSIRPLFHVEGDALLSVPPIDYEGFVEAQNELIDEEFEGQRSKPYARKIFFTDFVSQIKKLSHLLYAIQKRFHPSSNQEMSPVSFDQAVLNLNLKIIQEMNKKTKAKGSQLIFVDVFEYFEPRLVPVSEQLEAFCKANQIGYIDLAQDLIEVNRQSVSTRWTHDGHFNEKGNEIFAQALYQWILDQ